MKSWQHIYYSASRAAEALLYLIFTLVWLLITYHNCVRTRPNKTTNFTVRKKASHVTCHTAVLTHRQWYFSGFGASRLLSWQLWRQKHKCQNRTQDCFQSVYYLSQGGGGKWQGEKWSTINCRRYGKLQFGNQAPYNLNIQRNTSVTTQALQRGSNTHPEDSSCWIWSRIFGLLI